MKLARDGSGEGANNACVDGSEEHADPAGAHYCPELEARYFLDDDCPLIGVISAGLLFTVDGRTTIAWAVG